jgi:NADPH-dependent 2,4-dienoyl-CoA reductase/sulfur reductase-like enzyme/nitrite reductase/ring-hydroxylating ferredoxin subunit
MEQEICKDGDVTEGAMRAFEAGGKTLLVARSGGVCHAVGATCPHAGAPLAEGVLHDGMIICPWHKAAFRLATGTCTEPPAVDDLPHYPVRVANDRVLVNTQVAPRRPARSGAVDLRSIVIVGAGAAGASAAQTLREAGFAGRVVMVSREDRLPYDRTVLSKYALSGKQGGEKTPLQDAAFYNGQRIERMTGEVTAIDPASRTIGFADGKELRYDAALVATGGMPRPLQVPGHALPGNFLLRGPDDADAIVRAARGARRAVVVGAGFIGLEAAAALRERGLDVAVVAPQRTPLEDKLGPEVGSAFRHVHEQQGVVFHLGEEVAAVEGDGRVEQVRLKGGAVLEADLVVAGLGIAPAAGVVRGVPLRPDGGLDVNAELRVTGSLYAAGDIAAFPLYGGGVRVRVEHWRVAEQHGRVAALNMLGHGVPYQAVPYFWTISYLKRLDYVGHAEDWDGVVVDGDLVKPEFTAFYVRDGMVQAVAGWSRDQAMATAIPLMTERHDWTVAELRQALAD